MKISEAKEAGIDVSHRGSNENPENGQQYVYGSVPCETCGAYWFEGCLPKDGNMGIGGTFCDARIETMEWFDNLDPKRKEVERQNLTSAYKTRKQGIDEKQLKLF